MNFVQRVKEILLNPKQAWPVIEAESTDVTTLYTQYIMILALIPAVAGFIGMSLIGYTVMGQTIRIPLFSGIVNMVVSYVLSLVMVYVLALLADTLAPKFEAQQNPMNALKLIAYSSTAGMVGGVLSILPALSILGLLASLYSVYLLFIGVPVMMKAPQQKALPYTAILLVFGLAAAIIIGAASALFR